MKHHELDDQICTATYKAGELEVHAKLIARYQGTSLHYYIMLAHQEEHQTCDLGSDMMCARRLFFDVVFGGVTVCTLEDVIEDRLGTLF